MTKLEKLNSKTANSLVEPCAVITWKCTVIVRA